MATVALVEEIPHRRDDGQRRIQPHVFGDRAAPSTRNSVRPSPLPPAPGQSLQQSPMHQTQQPEGAAPPQQYLQQQQKQSQSQRLNKDDKKTTLLSRSANFRESRNLRRHFSNSSSTPRAADQAESSFPVVRSTSNPIKAETSTQQRTRNGSPKKQPTSPANYSDYDYYDDYGSTSAGQQAGFYYNFRHAQGINFEKVYGRSQYYWGVISRAVANTTTDLGQAFRCQPRDQMPPGAYPTYPYQHNLDRNENSDFFVYPNDGAGENHPHGLRLLGGAGANPCLCAGTRTTSFPHNGKGGPVLNFPAPAESDLLKTSERRRFQQNNVTPTGQMTNSARGQSKRKKNLITALKNQQRVKIANTLWHQAYEPVSPEFWQRPRKARFPVHSLVTNYYHPSGSQTPTNHNSSSNKNNNSNNKNKNNNSNQQSNSSNAPASTSSPPQKVFHSSASRPPTPLPTVTTVTAPPLTVTTAMPMPMPPSTPKSGITLTAGTPTTPLPTPVEVISKGSKNITFSYLSR